MTSPTLRVGAEVSPREEDAVGIAWVVRRMAEVLALGVHLAREGRDAGVVRVKPLDDLAADARVGRHGENGPVREVDRVVRPLVEVVEED